MTCFYYSIRYRGNCVRASSAGEYPIEAASDKCNICDPADQISLCSVSLTRRNVVDNRRAVPPGIDSGNTTSGIAVKIRTCGRHPGTLGDGGISSSISAFCDIMVSVRTEF
jgi:hypothetical protein